MAEPLTPSLLQRKVVNLALYKAKKALEKEGFEVIENAQGKITLVIRMAK